MKTNLISYQFLIALIFTLVVFSLSSIGQKTIEVKTTKAQMSKGDQPCYVAEVPQSVLKTVQQNWIKKLQEGNKVKVKEIGQELVYPGVVIAEITADTLNVFSLLIPGDSMVTINMFVEIDSTFFGPNEDKTVLASEKTDSSIKNYLRLFAVGQYRIAVEQELEAQEKILKTMQSDLEKLEKDQEGMEKEISSFENDIEESEREISELDKKIELKNQEINAQSTSMLNIALDSDKKAAQEKQKQLEKEKKELEKDRSKAKDSISSDKSDIKNNEKEIEDSKEQQTLKAQEITNQMLVVDKVKVKLSGIK